MAELILIQSVKHMCLMHVWLRKILPYELGLNVSWKSEDQSGFTHFSLVPSLGKNVLSSNVQSLKCSRVEI